MHQNDDLRSFFILVIVESDHKNNPTLERHPSKYDNLNVHHSILVTLGSMVSEGSTYNNKVVAHIPYIFY